MKVLVAGAAAMFDLILSADRKPGASEVGILHPSPGAAGVWSPGGAAFTIALAIRRQGLAVALWHTLAIEPDIARVVRRLEQAGIDLSACPRVAGHAARCVLVQSGAERLAWSAEAPHAPAGAAPSEALLDGIDHVVIAPRWGAWADQLMRAAQARNIPASLIGEAPPAASSYRWHSVVVDERQHAQADTIKVDTLVVTRGRDGALIRTGGSTIAVAAAAARVVDPTGAGDVFGGAFLARLLVGDGPAAAGRFAADAAARTCESWGAWPGLDAGRSPAPAAASRAERVRGALAGIACGDAFGMPNSFLPDPPWRTEMTPGPENSPYHAGYPAGRITDDTEQALALTQALEDGLTVETAARRLHEWFVSVGGASSLAVGPSTLRAMLAYEAGVAASETGRSGVTNGAAMRVTPIGVYAALCGFEGEALVDVVTTACWPTHATGPAIAGAAALAGAIAAGIVGLNWQEMMDRAVAAADMGMRRGAWACSANVAARIEMARRLVQGATTPQEVARLVSDVVGAGEPTTESVPAALAIADWAAGDPRLAIEIAGNLCGDTDTVAAMAGAVCGAYAGEAAIPGHWRRLVATVNGPVMNGWADRLERAALRCAAKS